MAVGSRFVKGGGVQIITGSNDTLLAYLMSVALNKSIQRILGRAFKDYTSGFIAFRRKVLDKISLRGDYGEYFIDFIYRARKLGYEGKVGIQVDVATETYWEEDQQRYVVDSIAQVIG